MHFSGFRVSMFFVVTFQWSFQWSFHQVTSVYIRYGSPLVRLTSGTFGARGGQPVSIPAYQEFLMNYMRIKTDSADEFEGFDLAELEMEPTHLTIP